MPYAFFDWTQKCGNTDLNGLMVLYPIENSTGIWENTAPVLFRTVYKWNFVYRTKIVVALWTIDEKAFRLTEIFYFWYNSIFNPVHSFLFIRNRYVFR